MQEFLQGRFLRQTRAGHVLSELVELGARLPARLDGRHGRRVVLEVLRRYAVLLHREDFEDFPDASVWRGARVSDLRLEFAHEGEVDSAKVVHLVEHSLDVVGGDGFLGQREALQSLLVL